jgi:ribA/ribD-fused uncharacterized protein
MTEEQVRHYDPAESILFRKTRDPFGGLSNMAAGFPIQIGEASIRTSEALYQALKYPLHPNVQQEILEQRSPMAAKMRSRFFCAYERKDWMQIRVAVMRWAITAKLLQNWDSFGQILIDTKGKSIVEHSDRDQFWGASEGPDGLFHGVNCLGRLLMQLRERMEAGFVTLPPLPVENFLLLGKEIPTLHLTRG